MSRITESDLMGINTYGYPSEIDEYGCMFIDLPHAKILVQKRPSYCDRGRFSFTVDVKPEHLDKMSIDWADCFPRYFFKLQRAFDEINDYIEFNAEKIGIEKMKIRENE